MRWRKACMNIELESNDKQSFWLKSIHYSFFSIRNSNFPPKDPQNWMPISGTLVMNSIKANTTVEGIEKGQKDLLVVTNTANLWQGPSRKPSTVHEKPPVVCQQSQRASFVSFLPSAFLTTSSSESHLHRNTLLVHSSSWLKPWNNKRGPNLNCKIWGWLQQNVQNSPTIRVALQE